LKMGTLDELRGTNFDRSSHWYPHQKKAFDPDSLQRGAIFLYLSTCKNRALSFQSALERSCILWTATTIAPRCARDVLMSLQLLARLVEIGRAALSHAAGCKEPQLAPEEDHNASYKR